MFAMNAFELVTICVTLGGVLLSFTPPFRLRGSFGDVGRRGMMWFDRAEDCDIAERPSEDAVDAPIPHRPLRARY